MPAVEVARLFGVSESSLYRWQQRQRTSGELTPGRSAGRPRLILAAQQELLTAQVAAQPDATLAEHCARWATVHGVAMSPTTMGRSLQRVGLPLKKRR
jgi:transposase